MAGFLDFSAGYSGDELQRLGVQMADAMRYRGPDEGNTWVDAQVGIALSHRRLSIQDLSIAGRQPMHSRSGRYVLIYNGEIYNFKALRKQLEASGAVFEGHSDTEVLLEALSQWGIEKTLPQLVGMFAFVLWDREQRALLLVRDRIGIKPLYWGRQGRRVFFASELSSLMAHPDFTAAVDRSALSALVAYNYIPGPRSIFKGIRQLPPGHVLRIDDTGQETLSQYWDVVDAARQGAASRTGVSEAEALETFQDLFTDAVRGRMIADVPLGAFLSGGVDSTLVSAVMQSVSAKPVQTFTVAFGEAEFNEAAHASAIAAHLGTDHHELHLGARDALDVVPQLAQMYCEPFADSSQIPTYLISAMARQHVTVALSGDGGDEGFAGYNRYMAAMQLWPRIASLPVGLRAGMGRAMGAVPHKTYDRLAALIPQRRRPSQFGDKMAKLAGMMGCADLDAFHAKVVRFWQDPAAVVVDGGQSPEWQDCAHLAETIQDPVERMQAVDMMTYLPGDILTKVDRASMAVGLEVRVPLLDHRILEFAWSLPMDLKIRNGQSKWLLRKALDQYVPRTLMERPKMGFAVPLGEWLRGPLRDWAEDLLSERSLADEGLFHPAPVREVWRRHLTGKRHEHYALWSILMAQAWHRTWVSKRGS